MKRQISMFLSSILFLLSPARGQTGLTMTGVVIEKGTGNPVESATVSVVGGKVNQDTTDSEGKFSLTFSE
jgi:membrane protein DedA with SNARE-associated domain